MTKEPHKQEKKEQPNPALKYSGLGIQMVVIILLAYYGGTKLDEKSTNSGPWWTITFILLGIFGALYLVIRDVIKGSKD